MNKSTSADEARYVALVGNLIDDVSRKGRSPTTALQKIAEKEKLTPAEVRLVGTAFNKSQSVHLLNKAASGKTAVAHMDLADPQKVVASMLGMQQVQKTAFQLPTTDMSRLDFALVGERHMQKVAADLRKPAMHRWTQKEARRLCDGYLVMHSALRERLESHVRQCNMQLSDMVRKTAKDMTRLSAHDLRKVAQTVVNGYPQHGRRLLDMLKAFQPRLDLPDVQKTAHAAVFPARRPYIAIGKIYEQARALANAKQTCSTFVQKQAGGTLSRFLTGTAANISTETGIRGLLESLQKARHGGKGPSLYPEDVLDDEIGNSLSEIERRSIFHDLVLNDRDLNEHNIAELVEAYNDVIRSVPDAADNVAVLKPLMLRYMATGGEKDIFELSQQATLAKSLLERIELSKGEGRRREDISRLSGEHREKLQQSEKQHSEKLQQTDKQLATQVEQEKARQGAAEKKGKADEEIKLTELRMRLQDMAQRETAQERQEALAREPVVTETRKNYRGDPDRDVQIKGPKSEWTDDDAEQGHAAQGTPGLLLGR